MVSEQLKVRVDRMVEQMLEALGNSPFRGIGRWRLFGVGAMLRIQGHWGSSSVIGWLPAHRGRTPFPYRVSTNPEYTPVRSIGQD